MQSIAETEAIVVSDEDVELRIQALAEANSVGINELKRSLRRNDGLEKLKQELQDDKVWEFLMQHAQIEDAAPIPLWVSHENVEAAKGEPV